MKMDVIIIDSLSHEWDGDGGILETHSNMPGNSFTNWSKLTPRHNACVQRILNVNAHVIATLRTKQDYVLTDKNGKMVPEKVGLKSITRDGMDYEFTMVFDIDITHKCMASKDKMFTIRVPEKLIEEYRQFCDENSMNMSKRIRKFMERDIEAWKIRKAQKNNPSN
jgi:predicted DNA binding CopG/RHH family protein